MKKSDSLAQFAALRKRLELERAEVAQRLKELDDVLGQVESITAASKTSTPRAPKAPRKKRSGLSLRSAVIQSVGKGALTKVEIMDAVKALGYAFGGKNPANTLGVVLYGKPKHFKNDNGKFSYIGPKVA